VLTSRFALDQPEASTVLIPDQAVTSRFASDQPEWHSEPLARQGQTVRAARAIIRLGLVFDMDPLNRQAIVQGLFGTLLFIVLIFWPAGTFDYWQGWLFLATFAAATVGFTGYLAIYDRPLLERRLKAGPQHEREWSQKIIVSLVFLAFFASIVVSALDHRYAWSPVAPAMSILGDVLILVSFLFIFWVTRVNSFAASNIRVEKDQSVIDVGPYAHVRHPMYAGAIWLFVGMPLALGSWWSLVLILPVMPVLLWRILDEEKILQRDLPGYTEYMRRVRSRLVPYVW
jgi:protein-S-isoprenylcysteine O-methyltransferase Ste14